MDYEYNDEPSFSLNDFKKWMANQKPVPRKKTDLIGIKVESKLSPKRLIKKIDTEDGNIRHLAREFYHYGGTIIDVDRDNILVEVDSGTFHIPRFFCKKLSDAP
jgi:hypothetical protein